MLKYKEILCITDPHCGHRYGLLPPECISTSLHPHPPRNGRNGRRNHGFCGLYIDENQFRGGFDAVFKADMVDGTLEGPASVELLTSNRDEQVQIAAAFCSISRET